MDVEDSVCKDESSTAIFPLLSDEQTVLKPGIEHRSLKVAWEDAKFTATVSDKSAAEKVRFQNEETTCEGLQLEYLWLRVIGEFSCIYGNILFLYYCFSAAEVYRVRKILFF